VETDFDKYKIIKGFISEEEQSELIKWVADNKNNSNLFRDAGMGGNRITTRYSKDRFLFPHSAYKIQKRIIDLFNFEAFILPHNWSKFMHGIIADIGGEDDYCFEHTDPQWYPPYETLHCNLMLQKPIEGGEPIIGKKEIDINERDMWCYYVSKVKHGSSKNIGNKPRIIYTFGFCIK